LPEPQAILYVSNSFVLICSDGYMIGGTAILVLIALAIFFVVRYYLNSKALAAARERMQKDEDEGFLSLDQPDADEFSDFSESP
jgi:hypothetical protein